MTTLGDVESQQVIINLTFTNEIKAMLIEGSDDVVNICEAGAIQDGIVHMPEQDNLAFAEDIFIHLACLDKPAFIETFNSGSHSRHAQQLVSGCSLSLAVELLRELEAVHQQDPGNLLIYAFCAGWRLVTYLNIQSISKMAMGRPKRVGFRKTSFRKSC
jgi:hypothetical protein